MKAQVTFSASPWLLLLILPVLAVVVSLFFIGKKRGSCLTVNRVLAAILQCAAAACCIVALSGFRLSYVEANFPEELVILVDGSQTAEGRREEMDGFVRDVLETNGGRCRVAVVLFGHGSKVVLDMADHDPEEAYEAYRSATADSVKGDATDIASALRLVWDPVRPSASLVTDPARAKVLLLSDGLETDGDALGAMKALVREGVRIETSFFADAYLSDASVIGVTYPAQSVFPEQEVDVTVTVKSLFAAETVLTLTDTDDLGKKTEASVQVSLKEGTQEITLTYAFKAAGFHELAFRLQPTGGETAENNLLCSYFEVRESDKLLILEKYQNESELLRAAIDRAATKGTLTVESKTLEEAGAMTAEDLAAYAEIVLYNGAQEDMTASFQNALLRYVEELGGGLFTVGGFEKDENGDILTAPKYRDPSAEVLVRHSYTEKGLKNSILASLLPVTVEEYKPPVAVVFIFDISASMMTTGGPIHMAAKETKYVLDNLLDPGDYAGLVTLQDSYAEVEPLLPVTMRDQLKATIDELEDFYDFNAPTCYAPALQQAMNMLLLAPDNVARRHIVLLSDGSPGDKFPEYSKVMEEAGKQGITATIVTYYKNVRDIDGETCYFNHDYDRKGWEINIGNMQKLAEYGNGSLQIVHRSVFHGWDEALKQDMRLDELAEVGYDSFTPKIGELSSEILSGITNLDLEKLTLGGYFPSLRKVDESVTVPLLAEGSPLYAAWTFGKGRVGSLLIDLEGVWSQALFEEETGKTLIGNIVSSLLRKAEPPAKTVIDPVLSERNFTTHVDVYGFDREKEEAKLVAFVTSPDKSEAPEKFDLNALSASGNRFAFDNPKIGIYTVQILKVGKDFDFMSDAIRNSSDIPAEAIIESVELRRLFSYSEEYDLSADAYTSGRELLAALSTRETEGQMDEKFVYDAEAVFAQTGLTTRYDDPRQGLLIAALVLYFLGIVVRRWRFFTPSRRRAEKK